ncbi:double-strand-break repair protein rad21-like protein 1 isoform X2 [Melanotaenia boesemani]|uniref:double-strand-break repair protein rad21-like protein 1 isoform X2 n=1 Tax=Melanotaenia boesemani TaxID=1250792 RepID=UPI001C053D58|nr:double-strand-break repair protein rad21-like protein 1 isoform X2 [Melanotaenia boesemani]
MVFYVQHFTSHRGSLAKIWLAAHWERKLTKAHIFECNLETTIRDIISPKINIGLRTSSHLLLGVVRIYSRKAKYLLADCNDALVRIKMAFRPGQTDMPVDGLEATIKAITLNEDFTTFDTQLPHPSEIDVVDHFSLNQSRLEEITLREDFGKDFLSFTDIDESLGQPDALLDRSFKSFAETGDTFGDEDREYDLLDFLTNPSDHAELMDFILEEPQNQESSTLIDQHQIDADSRDPVQAQTPSLNETTLLADEEVAFALEPVTITPNSEKKIGKRRRKLVVDRTKELSNDFIKEQLSDYSDLVAPLDMAPPTVPLMQWKESGGVDKLFSQPCSTVVNPQIKEIFAKKIFQVRYYSVNEEIEALRQERQEAHRDLSALSSNINSIHLSFDSETTHNAELTALDHMNNNCETNSQFAQDENGSECTHPDLPSEDSMFVHPSCPVQDTQDTQSTSLHTQSMLDSQDFEERRITRRAQKLLNVLKSRSTSEATFSLGALCDGATRAKAATTFICLLVLKKQQHIDLHQSAPYEDIIVTPGPNFCN